MIRDLPVSPRSIQAKPDQLQIITVIKLDHAGRETYRYQGRLIEARDHIIILEAFFDRETTPVEELVLRKGDRFIEYYFDDRWYNVFEIHDRDGDQIEAWYCNIGIPAEFRDGILSYRDLALDLLVYPDGRQQILDQQEFKELPLSVQDRRKAQKALVDLQNVFKKFFTTQSGLSADIHMNFREPINPD